jgi:osmoprotectant transport system permease protein
VSPIAVTLGLAIAAWMCMGVSSCAAARAADDESVAQRPVVVASKVFTESVILGELLTQALAREGIPATHRRELGGTRVVWNALEKGDVDTYVEYSGTLEREVLTEGALASAGSLDEALARRGVRIVARLGFDNSYVLGVSKETAQRLALRRISDLRAHPDLRLGLSNEFMSRDDGWPGLRAAYRLPQAAPRGMQHELAYLGIERGSVDVIDLNATDAEIVHYDLAALEDDLGFFPRYDALIVGRIDLRADARAALARLEGVLDAATMADLNRSVRIERRAESEVAATFLHGEPFGSAAPPEDSLGRRLLDRTGEHLTLVGVSLLAAMLVGVPLGIVAYLRPALGELVLGLTGAIQTIPALALLVFMIPWFGIGAWPAIAALFLYSLLPIVRNTHLGLRAIPGDVRESAIVLGLPAAARLRLVELPLAAPSMLAGIKTAAVINIGTATLGALIGAGGYGEPILTGIRLDDMELILEGAVPAALLALLVHWIRLPSR